MRVIRPIAVLLLAFGCDVTTVDPGPVVFFSWSGDVTFDWTVNGSTDPLQCEAAGADFIRIQIVTTDDRQAGTFIDACDAFATRVTLAAGGYTATASLVDAAGQSRTAGVSTEPFIVLGNDDLHVTIDLVARETPQ